MENNSTEFYVLVAMIAVLAGMVAHLYSGFSRLAALDSLHQLAMNALPIAIRNQRLASAFVSDEVLSLLDRVAEGPTRMWRDTRVDVLCRTYFTQSPGLDAASCFIEANQPPPAEDQELLVLMLKEDFGVIVMSANVARRSLVVLGNVPPTYPRFQQLSRQIIPNR